MHRLAQGIRALNAWATPVDYAAARQVLSPELMDLFQRMRRSEQLHSLRVMAALTAQGHTDPDLLVAALLHDCGKSRYPMTLAGRTAAVLVRMFAPEAFRRWSQGAPSGWRRPFVVAARHPAWSAEDMLTAGASPRAAELARRHQTPLSASLTTDEDTLLVAFQAADDVQ
jgi:hypothetical protein